MDESNKTEIIYIAQLLGSLILLGQKKKTCMSQMFLQSQMNQKMVNK